MLSAVITALLPVVMLLIIASIIFSAWREYQRHKQKHATSLRLPSHPLDRHVTAILRVQEGVVVGVEEPDRGFVLPGSWYRRRRTLVSLGFIMMILLDRFVGTSRLGRGIRATAQDPEMAVLMGVNIDRVIVVTFILGGLMAGVAALLFGTFFEVTQYNIGFLLGIKAFTAAVLGGIGNLRGALIGGFALGLIESYGASIFGAQWKDVIAFVVLVLVLLVRPTGLLGEQLARSRI